MRRIVVGGSPTWSDRASTTAAIRRVIEVYKGPYTLITDPSAGPGRYASVVAREHGWTVEPYEVDTKCGPACEPNHRRRGGPDGTYCPTARVRALDAQLELGPDLLVMLTRPTSSQPTVDRIGQAGARQRGIALWQYTQKRGA